MSQSAQARFPAFNKRRILILVAVVGVVIYLVAALTIDAPKLVVALQQLGLVGCAGVLGLSAVNYVLRFCRWNVYLRCLDRHLPWPTHLVLYLSGFAFTVSPGKAGEAVRALYLYERGVPYSESFATMFVERLLDVSAMAVLSAAIVWSVPAYSWLIVCVAVGVMSSVLGICWRGLPGLVSKLSTNQAGSRRNRLIEAVVRLLQSSRRLLHPRLLIVGLVFGVAAWGAEGLGFHLLCVGLNLKTGVAESIGIYSVAVLVGAAAVFLPAGIGGTEIVMTALLVSRGATLHGALIATLLCRVATLWFAVLLGVVAATGLEFSRRAVRVTAQT
jgi:glycosyltransferase 2 family protein